MYFGIFCACMSSRIVSAKTSPVTSFSHLRNAKNLTHCLTIYKTLTNRQLLNVCHISCFIGNYRKKHAWWTLWRVLLWCHQKLLSSQFQLSCLCTVHSLSCFQMLLKHFSSPDSVQNCSKAEKLPWLAVGSLCIEAASSQWPLKAIACLPPKIMVFAVGCSFQWHAYACV